MKKFKHLYPFLLAFAVCVPFTACDEGGRKNQQAATEKTTSDEAPDRSPYIGNWISLEYVKALRETRSPLQAQDNARLLRLTEEKASGVVNFHEGEDVAWAEKEGKVGLKTYEGFQPLEADGNVLRLGGQGFEMAAMSGDRPLIVEQTVLAGNYLLNDQAVQLSPTGDVSGLVGIHHYQAVYDYIGPGMNLDLVQMGPDADNLRDFIFRFEDDALAIYEVECLTEADGECLEITLGQPLFLLMPAGTPLTE
ncbi:MAG: hypothetical protein ACFB10_14655 [Salibacteraceae bacterium]|mgnify:CR=1 FL=1